MPFNGSGVFNVYTPGNPVVTGTVISSTVANATNSDFASGLTNAVTKDGQSTITAPIKFYAGTVGLPGLVFGTNTASGFYQIGANNWGFAASGAKVLDISSTGLGVTGALTATSITLGGGSTLSTYVTGTFTPTVTLVGGAGNTVPVYSTNSGRYTQIGNRAFVDVDLNGDGGAEGAGTGQITIALPVAASASFSTLFFVVGRSTNAGNSLILVGSISGSLLSLAYEQTISVSAALTGADQNNTSRSIRLNFNYET